MKSENEGMGRRARVALFDEPLRQAAARGQVSALQSYAKMGGDIDSRGRSGESALMLAAEAGHEECVKWLAWRADLSARDEQGRDAMWLACAFGQAGAARALGQAARERGMAWGVDALGRGPLMAAALRGSEEGARVAWEEVGPGALDALGLSAPDLARAAGWERLAQQIQSWMDRDALNAQASLGQRLASRRL